MELRRAADCLLRTQASPLVQLLTPSSTARWTARQQLSSRYSISAPCRRTFTSSISKSALRPSATTTAAPPPPPPSDSPSESESQTPSPDQKSPIDVDAIAKDLGWIAGSRREVIKDDRWKVERELRMNNGSSAADLLHTLSSYSPRSRLQNAMFEPGRMLDPSPSPANKSEVKDMMNDIASVITVPPSTRAPLRLNPTTGRSVTVGQSIDVGRGFRLLEQSCARNRVRADFNKQRFHERGGLKRKRLRRERWRKRFMEGFKATVGRVKQLKNQGW